MGRRSRPDLDGLTSTRLGSRGPGSTGLGRTGAGRGRRHHSASGGSAVERVTRARSNGIRGLWVARSHPVASFAVVVFVTVWVQSGSGLVAAAVTPPLTGAGGLVWVWFRARRTGVGVGASRERAARRRRVRRQWDKACTAAGLGSVPVLLPWQVRSHGPGGETVVVTVDAAAAGIARDVLTAGLVPLAQVTGGGCRQVRLRPVGDTGVVELFFTFASALDEIVTPDRLATALDRSRDTKNPTTSAAGLAVFGLAENDNPTDESPSGGDGSVAGGVVPVGLPLLNGAGQCSFTPLLIAGQSGSGKSSALWALLLGFLLAKVPVRLWVADPAGGVELAALEDALTDQAGTDEFRVERYADTTDGIEAMVGDLEAVMFARMATQKAARVRAHTPTVAEPVHLLIVDELLLLSGLLKKGKDGPLGRIQVVGRKAGVSVIACTQVAKVADIGPCRDLFLQRMAFRLGTRDAVEAAFGAGGNWTEKAPAHHVPTAAKGTGYLVDATGTRGDEAIRFRALHLTDAQVAQVARGQVPDAFLTHTGRGYAAQPDTPTAPAHTPGAPADTTTTTGLTLVKETAA